MSESTDEPQTARLPFLPRQKNTFQEVCAAMPENLTGTLIEALDAAAAAAPELPVEIVERLRGAIASCTSREDTAA